MKKPPEKEKVMEKKTVLGHPGGQGPTDIEQLKGGKQSGESKQTGESGQEGRSKGSTGIPIEREPEGASMGSTPIVWDEKPVDDPLLNTILADRYRILRRIGEGGMGVVYEAEHVVLEKRVALKVLSPDLSRKKELVERFFREAKAASRIGHENIVDITDIDRTDEGIVFFAMEFLDGMDLGTLIEKEEFISWQRAKSIIVQICRALGAAHAKGIIHRDLKPENIFLIKHGGRNDFVKVVDFGIAKFIDMEEEGRKLTKTGMIFGTPDYMSPEQASGKKPDHRIDIYALGVILYEMITGKVPFEADSFMGILTKHMFEEPDPPSKKRPDLEIPHDVEELIMRAMHKDRDKRFHSMSEFAAAAKNCGIKHVRMDPDSSVSAAAGKKSDVVYLTVPKAQDGDSFPEKPSDAKREAESTNVVAELPRLSSKSSRIGLYMGLAVIAAVMILGGFILFRMKQGDETDRKPTDKVASREEINEHSGDKGRMDDGKEENDGHQDSKIEKRTHDDETTPGKRFVKITVKTSPDKARVYLEEEFLGETPLLEKEVGFTKEKQTLVLKKQNYRDLSLSFAPDRDLVIDRSLQRIRGRQPVSEKVVTPEPQPKKKEDAEEKQKPDLGELKDPF